MIILNEMATIHEDYVVGQLKDQLARMMSLIQELSEPDNDPATLDGKLRGMERSLDALCR